MNAADFDQQIREIRAKLKEQKESPEPLEEMVLERLRQETETFDSTVLEVVYAWRGFESDGKNQTFVRTTALLEALLALAERKAMLRAVLYLIQGEIAHQQRKLSTAAEAFANAVDDLHTLHLDVDTKRLYAMVSLGDVLLTEGNKRDAEKIFLDVLSYPWYLVRESEPKALLRGYYVRAGLRLIDCRRGDLDALKEIFFVPATHRDLLPHLNAAIEEAKQAVQ